MATRTMIFGFIRVKTMADFRKGTWKLRENIRCVGGVEISCYVNSQKSWLMNVAYLKVKHGLRFHLFFFFSRHRIAVVFLRA